MYILIKTFSQSQVFFDAFFELFLRNFLSSGKTVVYSIIILLNYQVYRDIPENTLPTMDL